MIRNMLSKLFPEYALRREIARRRLDRLGKMGMRNFEAVGSGRLRKDFLGVSQSPDSAIAGNINKLRENVRALEYNSGYVAGPIRRLKNNVVGKGIRFQSRVRADDRYPEFPAITEDSADRFNHYMEKYFRQWAKIADIRMIRSFYEIQADITGALVRDGEALVIGRTSAKPNRIVPYCLQVVEADRLQTPLKELSNPKIRNGIRFDDEGAPASFFVLRRHPGDTYQSPKGGDFEEIPAFNPNGTRRVLHLFDPTRPEQTRGYSEYASGLKDMQDLDRYLEAEKMAALEAACLTGFVKSDQAGMWHQARTESNYDRIHSFEPGEWHYLKPGEDVVIHDPKRPTDAFEHFVQRLERGPANGLDIPWEVWSQNWAGLNYSNARTVLLQFYLTCMIRQAYLIDHFCVPVYENVARQLVAVGQVPAPGFDRRVDDYLVHGWVPPGWQWVDPLKESQGKQTDVENMFDTLTGVCASRGRDADEVIEERARELRRIKEIEEKYGITLRDHENPEPDVTEDDTEETQDGNKSKSILSFVRN